MNIVFVRRRILFFDGTVDVVFDEAVNIDLDSDDDY